MKRNAIINFSYRSGVECSWRCQRAGYLEQFYLGTGIQKNPRAYWLDVGIAVHIGLADMLTVAQVGSSLTSEESTQQSIDLATIYWDICGQRAVLTEYQFAEQRVLIEALLWAFYYHTLKAFLETYEVLWVEKEITEIVRGRPTYMMMSRPDAIVRDRATGDIVVISWKTIDRPTTFRRLFFKQDLQGMMEAHYAEEYLKKENSGFTTALQGKKVAYVQTIYLVKGERMKEGSYGEDEGVGDMFAEETMVGSEWRQNSFLCYPYSNVGSANVEDAAGFETLAWKYRYIKPGNISFSTLGKSFKKTLVTNTSMTVREWVQTLSKGVVFPSTMPTEQENPLSKVIVWENPSYRDEALMGSVITQVKETERRRHRDKKVLERVFHGPVPCSAEESQELRMEHTALLDKLFPQQLTSCSFPWRCQFQEICHTEQGRQALVQLELPRGYVKRTPHHLPELEAQQGAK